MNFARCVLCLAVLSSVACQPVGGGLANTSSAPGGPLDVLSRYASDLRGYWRMDHDWSDSSGNGHDGIPTGGATFGADAFLGTAAADLTAPNSYVDLGTSSALTPVDLTVSFWLKRTTDWSNSQDMILWFKDSGSWAGTEGFYVGREVDSKAVTLVVSGGNYGGIDLNTNDVFPLGQWTHVAITFDSTSHQMNFYVDGVVQPMQTYGTSPSVIVPNATATKKIGSNHLDGGLDEVAILSRALSADEVLALYTQQRIASGH